MNETRPYLRPQEVADIFGVGLSTVQRWCDAGKLESIRTVGGHRRITGTSVTRLQQEAAA